MRRAILTRGESTDEGTFGTWRSDSGFTCRTGELIWRDNAPERSCIPSGLYPVTWRYSIRHGYCYHVENVPGRSNVEIHSANFVGDSSQGKLCQLLGCIAPGVSVGLLDGQRAILESKATLLELEADLEQEDFELFIKWGDE